MQFLESMISYKGFNPMIELQLGGIKLSKSSLATLISSLSRNSSIGKLTLSNVNLGHTHNWEQFLSFLEETEDLTRLDLGWACMDVRKFCGLWATLAEKTILQSVNVQYNALDYTNEEALSQIVASMIKFLENNKSL